MCLGMDASMAPNCTAKITFFFSPETHLPGTLSGAGTCSSCRVLIEPHVVGAVRAAKALEATKRYTQDSEG